MSANADVAPLLAELDRVGYAVMRGEFSDEDRELMDARIRAAQAEYQSDRVFEKFEVFSQIATCVPDVVGHVAKAICGDGAQLLLSKATVLGRHQPAQDLHSDSAVWLKQPFSCDSPVVVAHLLTSNCRQEDGATRFVAGSHRLAREPTPTEQVTVATRVVETAAGDVLFWLGSTWHARGQRVTKGDRLSAILVFGSKRIPKRPRTFGG